LRTTSSTSCTTDSQCPAGLKCLNGTCETGVCVELCQQSCTTDANCVAGQTCTNGKCSTPYCISYGICRTISGVGSVCI
jgi:Cys-rich repeat protein